MGLTAVLSCVCPGEVVDDERAAVPVFHDPDGLVRVVVDHAPVVVPKDVLRRFCSSLHHAVKAECVSLVEVYGWVALNDCPGLCSGFQREREIRYWC